MGSVSMITIGITTYNRIDLLKTMAESLYASNLVSSCNIRIYDDNSTEYNTDELKKIFPTAVSIKRNTHNLKADKNTYQMYKDFLSCQDDYFFNADSDIIFHPDWLFISLELLRETEGILTLLNSIVHPADSVTNKKLSTKKYIGAAGTLFTRLRLQELMEQFPDIEEVKGFDWQWSEYFYNQKIPIYCVNNSLIQHIGYAGQNTGMFFDFGRNFMLASVSQGQTINDVFEQFLMGQIKEQERLLNLDNSLLYHIRKICVIVLKYILPKKLVNFLIGIRAKITANRKKPK
jgi:glycosyltransferase involved in cell wall biosynthesis